MPPKKVAVKKVIDQPVSDSESEESITIEKPNLSQQIKLKPEMYFTNNSINNSTNQKTSESDRVQLAHAINNFTLKSEQFIQEMKNFDAFKESIFKLDILIDTKKQEYEKTNEVLELDHMNKRKNLDNQYVDLTKKLKSDHDELAKKLGSDHTDKIKKCETEFSDKKKTLLNTFEDESIQMRRKLEADKTKACLDYAKESNMRFIKEDEYKELINNVQKAIHDYTELKKTFDKQCTQIREEEKGKYHAILKSETITMDLTHKASNAQLVATTEQQKKEIQVLYDTISNLKSEIREQRELTKEVAQASAKSQINQTISK